MAPAKAVNSCNLAQAATSRATGAFGIVRICAVWRAEADEMPPSANASKTAIMDATTVTRPYSTGPTALSSSGKETIESTTETIFGAALKPMTRCKYVLSLFDIV